jgi:hypothetical protein
VCVCERESVCSEQIRVVESRCRGRGQGENRESRENERECVLWYVCMNRRENERERDR